MSSKINTKNTNPKILTANKVVKNSDQLTLSLSIDKISLVMSNEEKNFNSIKTSPKNRWYNSLMSFFLTSTFVLLGVMLVCLVIYFAPEVKWN